MVFPQWPQENNESNIVQLAIEVFVDTEILRANVMIGIFIVICITEFAIVYSLVIKL